MVEDENGYHFNYDSYYLNSLNPDPVSLTLPLKEQPYTQFYPLNFIEANLQRKTYISAPIFDIFLRHILRNVMRLLFFSICKEIFIYYTNQSRFDKEVAFFLSNTKYFFSIIYNLIIYICIKL